MAEYLTKGDLRRFASELGSDSLRKSLATAQARSPNGTVFLSHSSKDDEYIPVVVRILENHGAMVYVDKADPTLSTKGPRAIAQSLRSRIRECRKFMMFASENSKDSRWIPWELGLADGHKGSSNVSLFPAVETAYETEWTEREYLGVYSRIVWGELEGHSKPLWMVWNQIENTAETLTSWISR